MYQTKNYKKSIEDIIIMLYVVTDLHLSIIKRNVGINYPNTVLQRPKCDTLSLYLWTFSRYNIDERKPNYNDIDPRLSAIYVETSGLVGTDGPREDIVSLLTDTEEKLEL